MRFETPEISGATIDRCIFRARGGRSSDAGNNDASVSCAGFLGGSPSGDGDLGFKCDALRRVSFPAGLRFLTGSKTSRIVFV